MPLLTILYKGNVVEISLIYLQRDVWPDIIQHFAIAFEMNKHGAVVTLTHFPC